MAKRHRSRPHRSRPHSRTAVPPPSPKARRPRRAAVPRPSKPAVRTGFAEAVGLYEHGLHALQEHKYGRAAEFFRQVLERYPEEKELHERARLYLNVCARQAIPSASPLRTIEDRVYAATLAINAGEYDQGLAHLQSVQSEDPDNDHAHYMLAVGHTLRGEPAEALLHLRRAVELNPDNRSLARQDPDLEMLRRDTAFRLALEPAGEGDTRRERRPPFRRRPSR